MYAETRRIGLRGDGSQVRHASHGRVRREERLMTIVARLSTVPMRRGVQDPQIE
jgi:hypothetical protein